MAEVFKENGNDPMVGVMLPRRYRILALLEKDGFVLKYFGAYEPVDQKVVIYLFNFDLVRDEQAFKRFQQAAKRLVNLEHPNIASVLDFDRTSEGYPYLITEHVAGPSLSEILQEEGVFSVRHATHMLMPVASALACAHSLGIIHAALQPSEIIIAEGSEGTALIKIRGCGIISVLSEILGKPLTAEQQLKIAGTAGYMSPEQCSGKVLDKRSDLYSFGCIFYQCLMGIPPFSDAGGTASQILQRRAKESVPEFGKPASDISVPADIVTAIKKCTARDPQRRYQSMQEMALAIAFDSPSLISLFDFSAHESNQDSLRASNLSSVPGENEVSDIAAAAHPSAKPSLKPSRLYKGRRGRGQLAVENRLLPSWPVAGLACLLMGIIAIVSLFIMPQFINSNLRGQSVAVEVERLIIQGQFESALAIIGKTSLEEAQVKDSTLLPELLEQESVVLLSKGYLEDAENVLAPLNDCRDSEAKVRKLISNSRIQLVKEKPAQAVALAQAALNGMADLSKPNSLLLADVLGVLSYAYSAAGNTEKAAATLKQVEQALQPEQPIHPLLDFQYKLAQTRFRLSKQEYPKAEQLANTTLGFAQERFGVGHPFSIISMLLLADVLDVSDKKREAESVLENALVLAQKLAEKPWPLVETVATRLARLQESMQKYSEAEKYYRLALVVAESNWGENNPRIIPATENLARYLRARKNIKGASAYELHLQLLTGKRKW